MEVLFSKPVVIALAVIGALLAICASALRASGKLNDAMARRLNFAGYVAMGVSMLLFVLAGLRGVPA
ncbi:MAG TPA: hypothetical protein VGN65_09070 [Casimicrobiaceae bacterium]|jgi:predicted membrane channel-forming protein YqfA (hemolysin III family)